MSKVHIASTFLSMAAFATIAIAHQDDPKLRDRRPPVQAAAFHADVHGVGTSGTTRGFTSDGVTLQSWLSLSALGGYSTGNDCWGYVSPSGREYAIVGVNSATIFVEVTNPGNAQIVETINGVDSLWRDVKVFNEYCYAVSEGGDGIQVIDMSGIDDGVVTLLGTVNSGNTTATHNVAIDTESGFLYRLGGGSNGFRCHDLNANPVNPPFVASWSDKYIHDAQFITYPAGTPYAGREIAFCFAGFNGGFEQTGLTILDVTDKSNIIELSALEHSNNFYSHQGWLTEDLQYIYLNDELDEDSSGTVTTTRILDVSDLSNPVEVGTCTTGLNAIDHNLYIKGDKMLQGQLPRWPSDLRHLESAGGGDRLVRHLSGGRPAAFNGMWSTYPYLPSGTIFCSDLERGLFVFQTAQIEISLISDLPDLLSPQGESIEVRIRGLSGGQPDQDSFTLLVDDGTGQQSLSLAPTSDPEIWRANFPDMVCGNIASWHIDVATLAGQQVSLPSGGASSPYEILVADGTSVAFNDDFQSDQGWTVINGATEGNWQRAVPGNGGIRCDNPSDGDGSGICYVTGNQTDEDVDGGTTVLTSPLIDCTTGSAVSYLRWYNNGTTCSGADPLNDIMEVDISYDGGATWSNLETVGPVEQSSGGWFNPSFVLDDVPNGNIRLRFSVGDLGPGSVVEAAIDGLSITKVDCDDLDTCPADCANDDGVVNVEDILELLSQFGQSGSCDADGSGTIDVSDILELIASYGPCP